MTNFIKKDLLQKEIAQALRFTSSQLSSLPSLQGVFLEQTETELIFKSTNLNDFYTSAIKNPSNKPFKTIFDAKKTIEFLNVIQNEDVAIELNASGVLFSTNSIQGEFNTFQLNDYPDFPNVVKGDTILLTKAVTTFLPMILFSSSKDDSRPVLTGVLIESDGAQLRFVSTDGFRLSLFTTEGGVQNKQWSFIAASKFLQELIVLNGQNDLNISYSKDEKIFASTFGSCTLISRTIEGDFPPYQKVVPQKHTTKLAVDRQSFLKNIKAVSIFARDQANIIVFDIQKDKMIIKPKGEKGEKSYAQQEIGSFDGEPVKVAFNYRFISEFLNTVSSERISIELTTSTSPVVFRMEDNPDYTHIIMPLRTEEVDG